MLRNSLLVLLAVAAASTPARGGPPAPREVAGRVEYTLKTPRNRDPVLGGPRDKVFVSVWIPEGVEVVRGGICDPFGKDKGVGKHWQAACRQWQFAYVQTDFDAVKKEEYAFLQTGLADLAKKTGHPELERLPLCFTGMSRGGGMSMQLAEMMPERTIAVAPVCLEVGPSSDATRRVPVVTVFGEKDGSQMDKLLAKLPAERKLGAEFAIAVQWNRRHEYGQVNNLTFVFFDDVIARRLPRQPETTRATALAGIPQEEGWLGDVSTWGKDGRIPTVAAWKDYKGERNEACWFPTQRTAAVWRAFVGGTKDVTISEPPGLGDRQPVITHPAAQPVAVKLAVSEKLKPRKVTLWDADRKLAEKAEGPWSFEVTLKPGVHAIIATAEDAGGAQRSSRPHTIVVE